MKTQTLRQLLDDRAARRAVALATRMADGTQTLLYPFGDDANPRDAAVPGDLVEAVRQAAIADKSGVVTAGEEEWFLNVFNPPLRLVVIGAVHIAQSLVPAAQLAGYDVTVIDPRTAFATAARFPDTALSHDWPDEALDALRPDHRMAVVTLTHDPKLDDPALHVALKAPVFYIGALGSKKTHGRRVERLTEAGFTTDEIARIHAPIGLAIGARSPAEIAIATLAEMTSVLRGGAVR